MKRLIAFLLAVLMLAGMGAGAFAEEASLSSADVSEGDSQDITVTAAYEAASDPSETNYVYIEWKGMDFTYSPGYIGDWDPDNLKYDPDTVIPSGWTSSDKTPYGTITFENRSANNTILQASVSFRKDESFSSSSYVFLKKSQTAENVGNAETSTMDLSVILPPLTHETEGKQSVYVVPYTPGLVPFEGPKKLGTITITISIAQGDPGSPGPEIFD